MFLTHKASIVFLALISALASACGADMHPGERCGSCHNGGHAPSFGVSGTVYATPNASSGEGLSGVNVEVTDSTGQHVALVTSESGNFFTPIPMRPPLQVTMIRNGVRTMMADASSGDCNGCHSIGSDAPRGRIAVQ